MEAEPPGRLSYRPLTPARWEDLEKLFGERGYSKGLQIAAKTVFDYVRRGLIPYVRIQSNVRFREHEILDWIEKHAHRPGRVYGRSANKN